MIQNIIVEYNQIIQNTFLYYFSEQIKYYRILFWKISKQNQISKK